MTDTPILHEYRCLECGFAWRSDNPEEARCPDCESGDIVETSRTRKDADEHKE